MKPGAYSNISQPSLKKRPPPPAVALILGHLVGVLTKAATSGRDKKCLDPHPKDP